jgi:hypothetical protein
MTVSLFQWQFFESITAAVRYSLPLFTTTIHPPGVRDGFGYGFDLAVARAIGCNIIIGIRLGYDIGREPIELVLTLPLTHDLTLPLTHHLNRHSSEHILVECILIECILVECILIERIMQPTCLG